MIFYGVWNILWGQTGVAGLGLPRGDGSSSAAASTRCQPTDKLFPAVITIIVIIAIIIFITIILIINIIIFISFPQFITSASLIIPSVHTAQGALAGLGKTFLKQ